MRIFTTVAVGLAIVSFAGAGRALADDAAKPNVLFIAVDDLNDWVGCMGGHPDAKTPHIDRLATAGVLFTNAHCAAPLCNPSRASVLTGMRPTTSGVHGNQQDWRKSPFLTGKATLPEYFRKQGYWTGAAGKIFHANHGCECAALNGGHGGLRGFNHPSSWTERHPSADRQLSKPAVPTGRNMNGLDIWHWDWGPIPVEDAETIDGKSVAWAEAKLAEKRERPFFLAVGIYRPHGPWYVPKKYFDAFSPAKVALPKLGENDLDDVPPIAKRFARDTPGNLHRRIVENDLYEEAVAAYLANIHFADVMVGRLLTALEQSDHADNTIVCLWSDHGWHLGEKQKWHKSTNWEEATRVPLIISAPGKFGSNVRVASPASLIDLYPTLIELCGLRPREDLDGTSLVPQLKDSTAKREVPAITTLGGLHHAVRNEHWRYIRYADGSEELYDHRVDPNEWQNLASDEAHAETKASLAKWIPERSNAYSELGGSSEERGFRPIFNGYDLTSWQGDDSIWKVADDALSASIAQKEPPSTRPTLIWRGAELTNFELRMQVRLNKKATSGETMRLYFRGQEDRSEKDGGLTKGYFIKLGAEQLGEIYNVADEVCLAEAGKITDLDKTGKPISAEAAPGYEENDPPRLKPGEWTELILIANQGRLTFRAGEKTISVLNDRANQLPSGVIALQAPLRDAAAFEMRNLRIKQY